MTYARPKEEHERELSSMPADDTRWLGRLVWTAVWGSGGVMWGWLTYRIFG